MNNEQDKAMAAVLKAVYEMEDRMDAVATRLNKYRSVARCYDQFTRDIEHFQSIALLSRNHVLRRYSEKYRQITERDD